MTGKFRFYFGIAVALLLASCSSEKSNNIANNIDPTALVEIESDDEFGSIIENIEFIPLETNDSCLLGEIRKCVEKDSMLFVLADVYDSDFEQELHCFTLRGKHIKKIGSKGQGPNEYKRLSAFDISGDTLLLYDDGDSQIKCYSLDGRYIGPTSAFIDPTGVNEICALGSTCRVLVRSDIGNYNPAIYSVINVNSDKGIEVIKEHPFDRSHSMGDITGSGTIGDWDDTTKLIVIPFDTRLYGYSPGSRTLRELINVATKEPYPTPEQDEPIGDFKKRMAKGQLNFETPIAATREGNWIAIKFYFGGTLWNLKTRKGYHTLNATNMDKLVEYPFTIATIIGSSNGAFIGWCYAEDFLQINNIIADGAPHKPSSEIVAGMKEESNPIIVKYHLVDE